MAGKPHKFKEEYCDMLVKHMEQGLSYESFAGLIGVTRDCLYKWEGRHESFLYSKKIGKEKQLLTLERIGLKGITGGLPGFNASSYIFTMKNKCGWSDKQEIDHTNNGGSFKGLADFYADNAKSKS